MTGKWRTIVLVILAVTLAAWLEAETRLVPVTPVRVSGGVSIAVRPTHTLLHMSLTVRRESEMVTGLDIELMGQKATEFEPGRYRCAIDGFHPRPGSRVTITFRQKHALPALPAPGGKTPLTATATITSLPAFTAPALDSRVNLASIVPLTVSWTGGTPPYSLYIFPFASKEELGKQVFEQLDIMGTSVSVPLAVLRPGNKYGIYMHCANADFSFSGPVDPGSRLKLRSSIATYIFSE